MKQCQTCGQILAQQIAICPACGSPLVAGLTILDDYIVEKIIHEGRSSLVFRAREKGQEKPVTIRLFTKESGVDETVASRLDAELKILAGLPNDLFVRHYAIRQSRAGLWYRVSEWVDADSWGSILVSGLLNDQRRMVTLFRTIASSLATLHRLDHFMPYLILDDILLPRDKSQEMAVKINYKLSRFLNARATHHGPMLKQLLAVHPDIKNQRAVDFRSAIWSLGKIFLELLTADHNLTEFSSRVDQVPGIDPELAVLVKIMLAEDPDLRPQSMTKVADTLEKILKRMPPGPFGTSKVRQSWGKPWFGKITITLVFLIALATAVFTFVHRNPPLEMTETRLSQLAESYTPSIGFLMVEYWLTAGEERIYTHKVEGTAFIVDRTGYLLTNRHVACPWLEDPALFLARFKAGETEVTLGYSHYLWFEGEKAFNRLPGLEDSQETADIYALDNAFSSIGRGNLRIAGVPKRSDKPGQGISAQFKDDFAVLKIDGLPENNVPLPMETGRSSEEIERLSTVVIMGFPLGSETQDERINASLTRGHVRRTSKALIQVDSSIYKGNSGGPAINAAGKVIGIASGVITDRPFGPLPLATPLSDFGLVLPISEAARFVKSLKAGAPKWDGSIDFSLAGKIKRLMDMAAERHFEQAAESAHRLLPKSRDPALVFAAGLLDFCRGDLAESRRLLSRALSIEEDNTAARLMLYIVDWLAGTDENRWQTRELFTMDWSHPDAFSGYLARILNDERPMNQAVRDYENPNEQAWRHFIDGMILEKQGQPEKAQARFKEVVLAAGANDQLFLMALARLTRLEENHPANSDGPEKDFNQVVLTARTAAKETYEKALALIKTFDSPRSKPDEKLNAVREILMLSPDNRTIMGQMAFFHAARSEGKEALTYIEDFFKAPGRETRLSLSLNLLKGGILKLAGNRSDARAHMEQFLRQTRNPWYRMMLTELLADASLSQQETRLVQLAGNRPARLITLHTALGLEAESLNDPSAAARHYREALGTYLDGWNEYDLARKRLLLLRRPDQS